MYLNDETIQELLNNNILSIDQISQFVKIENIMLENSKKKEDYDYILPDFKKIVNEADTSTTDLRKIYKIIKDKEKYRALTKPTAKKFMQCFYPTKHNNYLDYYIKCKPDPVIIYYMHQAIESTEDDELLIKQLDLFSNPDITKSAADKLSYDKSAVEYIRPDFVEGQVLLASKLYLNNFLTEKLLEEIAQLKCNEENDNLKALLTLDDAMFINAIDEKMNLQKMLDTLPSQTLNGIIFYKMSGYNNIEEYISKDDVNMTILPTLVKLFIDKGMTKEYIKNFLAEKKLELTWFTSDSLQKVVDNVQYFDFFYENNIFHNDQDTIDIIKSVLENLPEEKTKKICEIKDFSIVADILIYCYEQKDDTLIDILLNSEKNNSVYSNLMKLLRTEKQVDIKKIFFDKGNDVFDDYNLEYEFDCIQKNKLIDILKNTDLTLDDLEIIRDNQISAKKMEIISYIIINGHDTSFLKDKIVELSCEDMQNIKNILDLGFKITNNDINI